jgi:hypothetical protein
MDLSERKAGFSFVSIGVISRLLFNIISRRCVSDVYPRQTKTAPLTLLLHRRLHVVFVTGFVRYDAACLSIGLQFRNQRLIHGIPMQRAAGI